MIITIVCDVLGEENNGTTIAAMNLVRSMRVRGHEVRVVCPDENKRHLPGYYIVPGVSLGAFNGYVAKNGVQLAKADKKILNEAMCDADVVHIMLPYFLGASAARMAKKLGKPITAGCHALAENLTAHLFLMHAGLVNHLIYKIYYHILYRYCNCVHYPSQMMCDLFEGETRPMSHQVISNGVGMTFSKKTVPKPQEFSGRFVILFTGRYSKEKAHKVLIDGVKYSKHREEIQIIFAGSGPLEAKLKKYAQKRLPVQPVFGFFPRAKMAQIINFADLYVHPARYEAEGIACLEAMRCGKVILSSDSPKSATRFFALSEDNLFHDDKPESLANKIDYWFEHPEKRDECAEKYARFAMKYDFEKCMDSMEEMFYEAAGKSDLLQKDNGRLCRNAYQNAKSR